MSAVKNAIVVAALCVLSIALYQALHSAPTSARAAAQTRSAMPAFLRFQGTGHASMRPDMATIDFQVSGSGSTILSATNQASSTMARLLAAMHRYGIARADSQTSQSGGYCDDRTGRCFADQSLTVTVRNPKLTGRLLAVGLNLGAQGSYSPAFSTADQRDGQASALRAAIAAARAKASVAAAAAGLRLGAVESIAESTQPTYEPFYSSVPAHLAATGAAMVPVRLGRQAASETVTVVFSFSG